MTQERMDIALDGTSSDSASSEGETDVVCDDSIGKQFASNPHAIEVVGQPLVTKLAEQGRPGSARAPPKPANAPQPPFYVAVPSFGRAATIGEKTLALLRRHCVAPAQVSIFVASEEEKLQYVSTLGSEWPNVVVGVPSLWRQRNFIARFFAEGTHVLSVDDDVEEIYRLENVHDAALGASRLEPLRLGELQALVHDAWLQMSRTGANLWALNTSANPFKMAFDRISLRNGLCNGFFWGCCVRHAPELLLRHGDGREDVERTVRFFQLDGAVLRFRGLCVKTRCKKNRGGLQATMTQAQRATEERRSVEGLVREFPALLESRPDSILGVRFLQGKTPILRKRADRVLEQPSMCRKCCDTSLTATAFKVLVSKGDLSLLNGGAWCLRGPRVDVGRRFGTIQYSATLGLQFVIEGLPFEPRYTSVASIYMALRARRLSLVLAQSSGDNSASGDTLHGEEGSRDDAMVMHRDSGWLVPPGKRSRMHSDAAVQYGIGRQRKPTEGCIARIQNI